MGCVTIIPLLYHIVCNHHSFKQKLGIKYTKPSLKFPRQTFLARQKKEKHPNDNWECTRAGISKKRSLPEMPENITSAHF